MKDTKKVDKGIKQEIFKHYMIYKPVSKNALSSRATQTARLFLNKQSKDGFIVSVETILLWDLILQFTHLKYINSFFEK